MTLPNVVTILYMLRGLVFTINGLLFIHIAISWIIQSQQFMYLDKDNLCRENFKSFATVRITRLLVLSIVRSSKH
jgi:hypothetical protein